MEMWETTLLVMSLPIVFVVGIFIGYDWGYANGESDAFWRERNEPTMKEYNRKIKQ